MEGKIKKLVSKKAGLFFVYLVMWMIIFITLYPFIYVFSMSVSDPMSVLKQEVWFLPKGFNLNSYKKVFENAELWMHYGNTVWYTIVGTLVNMVLTLLGAYPLSRKNMYMRKPIMFFVTFTMFFSGGIIPLFIVVNKLGLYDSRWSMILPVAVNAWNLIIARTYIEEIGRAHV